jgi:DNA-directed RNA polymerase subunit RPC12/RpoP
MTTRPPEGMLDQPYGERPDPDEPWRYACPHCESVIIRSNTGNGSTPKDIRAPHVEGPSLEAPDYRCRSCKRGIDEDELVDRKARE